MTHEPSTTDMRVNVPAYAMTETTIKTIHYGANYVFCQRLISQSLGERALRYLTLKYGYECPASVSVVDRGWGASLEGAGTLRVFDTDTYYLDQRWRMVAHDMTPTGLIVRMR